MVFGIDYVFDVCAMLFGYVVLFDFHVHIPIIEHMEIYIYTFILRGWRWFLSGYKVFVLLWRLLAGFCAVFWYQSASESWELTHCRILWKCSRIVNHTDFVQYLIMDTTDLENLYIERIDPVTECINECLRQSNVADNRKHKTRSQCAHIISIIMLLNESSR